MTRVVVFAPESARSPRGALAGDWRLANAALAIHTEDGTGQPEELCAEGELHVAKPADTTVCVRLAGVGGIERVGFEFNFDSRKIHGDGRAGSVDGLLRIAGTEIRVHLWFEFQALVGDALHQQHAVFTTDVPLGLLGLHQSGYATLELDFVHDGPIHPVRVLKRLTDPTRVVGRIARPNEEAAVRGMLQAYRPHHPGGDRPLATVVALFADEVVGVARAWPGPADDTAWASFGITPRWRNTGLAAFLSARLAHELQSLSICTIVRPPPPASSPASSATTGTTQM